jgi:hypothetical protein
MSEQESQVEPTAEGQAEATESQVDEATVLGNISELLGNQQEEEQQPIQPEAEVQPEVEPEKPQELTIDEAMVNEHPELKMYLGKPLKDLGKAYSNIVKAFTKNQMRLKEIEKEQAKKIPKASEFPDSVEKPDDFEKALAEYTERIRKEAIQEYRPEPQIDWVAEVGRVLPQGVEVKDVINGFTKFNASRFYDEMGNLRPEPQQFYDQHPEILLNEIKSYYELSSNANKNKNVIQKESNDKAYKTITNSLKKAQENVGDLRGAQFNAVERTTQNKPEDEILAKIYKIAQGQ